MPLVRFLISVLLAAALLPQAAAQVRPDSLDLLIRGGYVLDGSGRPAFRADVGVRDGRIVEVGEVGRPARRVLAAEGFYVAPGFVDIHSHADGLHDGGGLHSGDPERRSAPNLVAQGITTVLVNQDGRSGWPISGQKRAIAQFGSGPNVGLLVGHGTIRWNVMGEDHRRRATPPEIRRMQSRLRQAMREGALGLSAGLEYEPGRWSSTDELVALARLVGAEQGVIVVHLRSEGLDPLWHLPDSDTTLTPSVVDAVEEGIEVARQSSARLVLTHLKARGMDAWGSADTLLALIQKARNAGAHVWADRYPYESSGSDGAVRLIPAWVYANETVERLGTVDPVRIPTLSAADRLRAVMADSAQAGRLVRHVAHEMRRRGGAERVFVVDYPDSAYVGRSLAAIADERRSSPVQAALDLQLEGYADRQGGVGLRGFSIDRQDLSALDRVPWMLTSSDAGIELPGDGPAHPRAYGAFPRTLRRALDNGGEASLAEAVRRATMLPADVIGLPDRGRVQPGAAADLIVFDADRLSDAATFEEPHRYPDGMLHVFVNGVPVVREGIPTGARPGILLERHSGRES